MLQISVLKDLLKPAESKFYRRQLLEHTPNQRQRAQDRGVQGGSASFVESSTAASHADFPHDCGTGLVRDIELSCVIGRISRWSSSAHAEGPGSIEESPKMVRDRVMDGRVGSD